MNPAEIAEAVADQLKARLGQVINVYAIPTGSPRLPALEVEPDDGEFIQYQRTLGQSGLCIIRFRLKAIIDTVRLEDAYRFAYSLLTTNTPTSVYDALAVDPTFGGRVSDLKALNVIGPTLVPVPEEARSQLECIFPMTAHEPQRPAA